MAEEDDDDLFGDFNFVSSSSSNTITSTKNTVTFDEDEDWGDFSFVNGKKDEEESSKIWLKPDGALPLSLFGDNEVEEETSNIDISGKSNGLGVNTVKYGSGFDLNDLYGKEATNLDPAVVVEEGDEDDGWEFQDASMEFKDGNGGCDDSVLLGKEEVFEWSMADVGVISATKAVETTASVASDIVTQGKEEIFDWSMADVGVISAAKAVETTVSVANDMVTQKSEVYDWLSAESVVSLTAINAGGVTANTSGNMIQNGDFDWSSTVGVSMLHAAEITKRLTSDNFVQEEVLDWPSEYEVSVMKPEEITTDKKYGVGVMKPEEANTDITSDNVIQDNGKHEKQKGALPLSIFSSSKQFSEDAVFGDDFVQFQPKINGFKTEVPSASTSLSDLISNLYSHAEQTEVEGSKREEHSVQNGLHSNPNKFGGISWELKNVFAEIGNEDGSHLDVPSNTKMKTFVDFYSRLKEQSYFIALQHIKSLKKTQMVASSSSEDITAVNEVIKTASKALQLQNVLSEIGHLEEHPPENSCFSELRELLLEQKFQVLESEYHLSKRMSSAVTNLCSATGLFEHASSMMNVLTLGSLEEKHNYITSWSTMLLACSQELKLGESILNQSLQKNVHHQILSKSEGQQYFLALGEISRVVAVLRTSIELYKAWILSTNAGGTNIFDILEECEALWSGSRMDEALRSICGFVSSRYEKTIKELLESIKYVHDLNEHDLQSHAFPMKGPICRFSLLPLNLIPGMKTVIWNGEHYFLSIANFWANCVSCDLPNLPHFGASSWTVA